LESYQVDKYPIHIRVDRNEISIRVDRNERYIRGNKYPQHIKLIDIQYIFVLIEIGDISR